MASHVKGAAQQEHVLRAKGISGLLLSDVREVVSEIRQEKELDLFDALKALTQNIPGLKVDMNVVVDESMVDARQAEVIVRCVQEAITNIVKHAQASYCNINLLSSDRDLHLCVADNGNCEGEIIPGNGLTGIAERVEKIDGRLDYHSGANGFSLNVTLPKIKLVR